MDKEENKGNVLSTEELKKVIEAEYRNKGISLSEDELNAKVLQLCELDNDALENVSGGLICDEDWICSPNFLCLEDYYWL